MLALKCLLMILGTLVTGSAAGLAAYDIFLSTQLRRLLRRRVEKRGLRFAQEGSCAHGIR